MHRNQDGFVEVAIAALITLLVVGLFFLMFFIRFQSSSERVSGIVYNTKNDRFISGNTTFSVRADVNTYVSSENESSYCLPPNSPYISLVNKAAEDKRIKVVVESHKYFAVQAPWVCNPNVTVTEVK